MGQAMPSFFLFALPSTHSDFFSPSQNNLSVTYVSSAQFLSLNVSDVLLCQSLDNLFSICAGAQTFTIDFSKDLGPIVNICPICASMTQPVAALLAATLFPNHIWNRPTIFLLSCPHLKPVPDLKLTLPLRFLLPCWSRFLFYPRYFETSRQPL